MCAPFCRSAAVVVVLATLLTGPAARADDVGDLLKGGPLVRIEVDAAGKLKQATCIADVDAPIDQVWAVLTDYRAYQFFMPRVTSLEVEQDGADTLLSLKLDTPLVTTKYTNRQHADAVTHTITIKQERGDLAGSRYQWKLAAIGNRTRVTYAGMIKNFSSLAERFEDEQQTISIGVNVVSLMATVKAVKVRAEQLQRAAPAAAPVTTAAPTLP